VEPKAGIDSHLQEINSILEELGSPVAKTSESGLQSLISLREEARKNKDYAKGDLIRSRLKDIGIILEDKPDGTRWKVS
jgi:cysteinyl-tRNA synthetase